MAEYKRVIEAKKGDEGQKQRTKRQGSQPLFEKSLARDVGPLSLTDTPFHPRIEEHTAILSRIPFPAQRHQLVMQLQQTYGNRYIQRLVESVKAQAKLNVSDPNDIYEQEANRVAESVTKTIASSAQQQVEPEEEEEEPVQAKVAFETQRQELPEEELQAQLMESRDTTTIESLETRINNARGSGFSLSGEVREPMERAFGADFSGVRAHTDSEADLLNKQFSARAFTTGQDIFFRDGEYSPGSDSGKKLIANELTHVVQQQAIPTIQKDDGETTTTTETPTETTTTEEESSERVGIDETRLSALRAMWDAAVVRPIREAYEALGGEAPDAERAGQSLRVAVPAIDAIVGSYVGIEPARSRLNGFRQYFARCVETLRPHLEEGPLPLEQVRQNLNPDDGGMQSWINAVTEVI